jgi:hypothetical protein
MSFSRLRYDECATKLHNQRSVGVGEYRLFPGYVENCEQCYSLTGPVGSKADVSTAKNACSLNWGEMTQIESELQSRNIPATECNENATNVNYSKNKVFNKKVCSPMLNAEDTRFTNPVQSYRSMSLTSYQLQPWLFSNPQCHVQDDRIGLGSRNTAKDAYKMPLPEFLDKGDALPKAIKPSRMCTQ